MAGQSVYAAELTNSAGHPCPKWTANGSAWSGAVQVETRTVRLCYRLQSQRRTINRGETLCRKNACSVA
jgi:hypothetical protein